MTDQWKDVPRGTRSDESVATVSSCGDYTPNVPQACFESVHAFVISCFGNEGPRFPDNLLDEPAVSDLVETMTSWFGWNEIERKENVLSLKKLIDRSFTRFGQPQPGKKTAFVLFYGGLGEETVTGKLKALVQMIHKHTEKNHLEATLLMFLDTGDAGLVQKLRSSSPMQWFCCTRGTTNLQDSVLDSGETTTQLPINLFTLGNRLKADRTLPFSVAFDSSDPNTVALSKRLSVCTLFPAAHMAAFQRQLVMIGDNPKISVSNRGEWESVDVFMIAMDDTDIDDLEKELQDLQRVMVDQLHWRVQRHQLRSDTQRSLDLSIAALLEVIVGTCNGRKNALCWVLCSGHGGNRDGSLSWTGRSDSEPWVNVTHFQQQLLSKLDCSVIIQTDLCYAGLAANHAQLQQDLLRPYPKETPSQELLLSCGVPETSTMGTRSFSQDTTQALRGLLDQEAPLTLQDIVRVSHRKNVRYTASCVRLRLNGPRVIELYQCYQNLHQQVRSKLLRWVAKLIPETRCFVAVLGPRVNRRWNTEDIVRYECNLARTVDDVMGWYKAKIKAPDE